MIRDDRIFYGIVIAAIAGALLVMLAVTRGWCGEVYLGLSPDGVKLKAETATRVPIAFDGASVRLGTAERGAYVVTLCIRKTADAPGTGCASRQITIQ